MNVTKRPGPRHLTLRGAAVRARIVEAAADLVYSSGVGRTSFDDVIDCRLYRRR
jgi:AcrR family transcriptional regulator